MTMSLWRTYDCVRLIAETDRALSLVYSLGRHLNCCLEADHLI
jgi:hypothetical protein